MDPETPRYIDLAKYGVDLAHKTGLLGRVFEWAMRRDRQPNYRELAENTARERAIETIAGLHLTVEQALQILAPDFQLEGLARLDPTWQRHWEEKASRVAMDDDERRSWWARLLAGELQQPGSFSLRALAVMDTLSTEEARLFTKVCAYVWMKDISSPVIVLPPGAEPWHLDNAEELALGNCGLIEHGSPIEWYFTKSLLADASRDDTPLWVHMGFGDDNYILYARGQETEIKIRCGSLRFTEVGKEVFRLATQEQRRIFEGYRDRILSQWRESFDIVPVRLIDVNGDGSEWKFDPIKDAN